MVRIFPRRGVPHMGMRSTLSETERKTILSAQHLNILDAPIASRIEAHAFQKIGRHQ
jgi:hypothetical protein